MRFSIPPALLAKLRATAAQHPLGVAHLDGAVAFVLDPGLGPIAYLTADGRVVLDRRGWEGHAGPAIREASDDEATRSLVVGAKKTGVGELLELLPPRPRRARVCGGCAGRRWIALGSAVGAAGGAQIVCGDCHGRGWTS